MSENQFGVCLTDLNTVRGIIYAEPLSRVIGIDFHESTLNAENQENCHKCQAVMLSILLTEEPARGGRTPAVHEFSGNYTNMFEIAYFINSADVRISIFFKVLTR